MRATMAFLAATMMILALADTADAGSVANDAPFCTKKQELIAYARATVAKDVTRMMELVSGDGTCMVLSSKTEATLLSKHDGGSIVEVRLFKRGKTLDGFAMTKDFVQSKSDSQ